MAIVARELNVPFQVFIIPGVIIFDHLTHNAPDQSGTRALMAVLPFAFFRFSDHLAPTRSDFNWLSKLARSISTPTRNMSVKECLGFGTSRMLRK